MRQFALTAMDACLFGGLIARWSYHLGLQGELRVTQCELRLGADKDLPAPLVLAFASDFHAGPTTHPRIFETLVDEMIRHKPDVVLLGGDYVSSNAKYARLLAATLARLEPPQGIYAVLGNHDWWTDDEQIVHALQSVGMEVLVNRNRSLNSPFGCVSICGLDDPWTGNADPAMTFAGAGPIRVFLTHSPDGLLLLKQEQFDIAFAGHTHGGQIAFPDGTQIVTAGGPLSRTYGRGQFELAGNGPLVVSRGIGCSNVPIRINSDPELIICTLLPA
jgi:predicted MPP superfamily phosphohydrolase